MFLLGFSVLWETEEALLGVEARLGKDRGVDGEAAWGEVKSKHVCMAARPSLTFTGSTAVPGSNVGANPFGRMCRMLDSLVFGPCPERGMCRMFKKCRYGFSLVDGRVGGRENAWWLAALFQRQG